MFAFGGKADMACCGNPLLRSLLGVKRTCPFALHMSAYDPKRTWAPPFPSFILSLYDALSWASGEAMRRRDKAGGKAIKTRRHKTTRRNVPKAARRSSFAADKK